MAPEKTASAATVITALGIVERFLTTEEKAPRPPGGTAWRDFLREAARAGARLLRAEPAPFCGLGFDAEALARAPQRLMELEQVREAMAARLEHLDAAVALQKQQLLQRTRRLHEALGHKLADPSLEADLRQRLTAASVGLRRAFAGHAERQERRRQRSLRSGRALEAARQAAAALGPAGRPQLGTGRGG